MPVNKEDLRETTGLAKHVNDVDNVDGNKFALHAKPTTRRADFNGAPLLKRMLIIAQRIEHGVEQLRDAGLGETTQVDAWRLLRDHGEPQRRCDETKSGNDNARRSRRLSRTRLRRMRTTFV